MNIKALFADEDAVSPVIGVILMVAITVILAAVIGTFVLGLGDQVQSTAPQASFTFDFTDNSGDDELSITHDGGDKIDAARVSISISGANHEGSDVDNDPTNPLSWTGADPVTAGSTVTLTDGYDSWSVGDGGGGDGDLDLNPATVRMVWESKGGDDSATLGKWEGPDA